MHRPWLPVAAAVLLAAACSSAPAKDTERPADDSTRSEDGGSSPSQDREAGSEPAPNTCTQDSDCTTGPQFDPDRVEGCCPAIAGPTCVAAVLSRAEANRRRVRWQAKCPDARCPPSASCAVGIWTPAPVCKDGLCVDAARPVADAR